MLDDIVLGRLVDLQDNDSDEDQCDLNAESLYIYDQKQLLESVKYRVSKYAILYYLDTLNSAPFDLWKSLLRNIIDHYSLNSLKPYLSETFPSSIDVTRETKLLFYFLKVTLINIINENTNLSINDIISRVKERDNNPWLFGYAIDYLDADSMIEFQTSIRLESKQDYNENF